MAADGGGDEALARERDAAVAGLTARRKLRQHNIARDGGQDPKKLKSDLKRSTALVKRLKNFNSDDLSGVLAQIRALNLTRYVSEVVQSLVTAIEEGKLKVGDAVAAAEACGVLHQMYADFTPDLIKSLLASFDTSALATTAATTAAPGATYGAARATARLLLELYAVGVHQDEKVVLQCLCMVAAPTGAGGKPAMPPPAPTERVLAVTNLLLKYYGEEVLGLQAASAKAMHSSPPDAEEKDQVARWASSVAVGAAEGEQALISEQGRKEVAASFRALLESAQTAFGVQVSELESHWQENAKIIGERGELPEERKQSFQDLKKAMDKFRASVATLADMVGTPDQVPDDVDMSKFSSGETNTSITFMSGLAAFYAPVEEFGTASLFDDEEQRSFYEDFPDLAQILPPWVLDTHLRKALLRGVKPGAVDAGAGDDGDDGDGEAEEAPAAEAPVEEGKKGVSFAADTEEGKKGKPRRIRDKDKGDDEKGDKEDGEKQKDGKRVADFTSVDALLKQLYDRCGPGTDDWIVEFVGECYCPPGSPHGGSSDSPEEVKFTLSFAASCRKRLLVAMLKSPRTALNLLPHFARIAGTMTEFFRDFGANLSTSLEDEFEKMHEKQSQTHIESRRRNIRFLCELVKAKGIVQPATVLRCFAQCLDNFAHFNIEVACQVLEVCGRYLYRNQNTSVRLQNLIQHMKRTMQQKSLDQKYEAMIESALQEAKPPELQGDSKKVCKKKTAYSPVHQYIRKLVYEELDSDPASLRRVVRAIRKLDWDDAATLPMVVRTLRKVYKVQADLVPTLATVVASVSKHHPEVRIRLVDLLLEQIRLCLEVCPPARDGAHQPVKQQRRLLDLQYFSELYIYRLVDEGVIFDLLYTLLFYAGWNDTPNDYFRIRLVCSLLEGTAPYAAKLRQGRRKLYRFLPCFYQYVFKKAKPFPIDIDNVLADLVEMVHDVAADRAAKMYITFPANSREAGKLADHLEKVLLEGGEKRRDAAGGRNPALHAFVTNLRDAPGNPGAPGEGGGRNKHGLMSNSVVPYRNKVHPVRDVAVDLGDDDEEEEEEVQQTDERRRAVGDDDSQADEGEPGQDGGSPKDAAPDMSGRFLMSGVGAFAGLRESKKKQSKDDDDFLAMFADTLKESLHTAKHETQMRQMKDGGRARAEEKMAATMNMPITALKKAGEETRLKRAGVGTDIFGKLDTADPKANPEDGKVPFTVVLRRKGAQTDEVSSLRVGGKSMAIGTLQVPADCELLARQQGHRQRKEEEEEEARRKTAALARVQQHEQQYEGAEDDIGPLSQQAAVPRKGGKGGGGGGKGRHTQTTLGQHRQPKPQHQ